MKTLNSTFDIVIVGGGINGAAMAARLASSQRLSSLSILLLDAEPHPAQQLTEGFDSRVVALTHASQQMLTNIGAWGAISTRATAYQQMYVWDGEGSGEILFDAASVHSPHLGHIVENSVVVCALETVIAKQPTLTHWRGVKVVALDKASVTGSHQLILDNGHTLTAGLVIAADGARSTVRALAGFKVREWSYNQRAIVTTIETEKPHQATAYQRFMKTGPLAFLPLAGHGQSRTVSIVWSVDEALAESIMALSDTDFCASLSLASEVKLGRVIRTASRLSLPLYQRHAVDYIQPGIALIGDAAHSIHPLAGQGVNLGLLDVEALAVELERAITRGLAVIDFSLLRRYQRARLTENLSMMMAMEAFKQSFGTERLPVLWLRNSALRAANRWPLFKRLILKHMVRVPALEN